ncbi:MAG: NAD(P)H-dependent oxidoreductase [Candidatus Omnitrophica bacterium]|nr:NAD(P)H-dependent oxidoreductase [Candidatus Omnitrophota bacterium]
MPNSLKVLAFAGSARTASFNKKLIKVAVEAVKKIGAEVTLVDLKDYPMPLFDQDSEATQGMPENARKVKEMMISHDAFLISAPEYNSSITPLLKNILDWASRVNSPNENSLIAYKGKVAALLSASPGALGGLRGLETLRSILGNIGVIVLPTQLAVSKANEAFHDDGRLKDSKQQESLEKVVKELVEVVCKLKGIQ